MKKDCIESEKRIFSKDETVCIKPTVSGFEPNADGRYAYEMDIYSYNESKGVISYREGFYSDEGYVQLPNGRTFGSWISTSFEHFEPGTVTYNLSVFVP